MTLNELTSAFTNLNPLSQATQRNDAGLSSSRTGNFFIIKDTSCKCKCICTEMHERNAETQMHTRTAKAHAHCTRNCTRANAHTNANTMHTHTQCTQQNCNTNAHTQMHTQIHTQMHDKHGEKILTMRIYVVSLSWRRAHFEGLRGKLRARSRLVFSDARLRQGPSPRIFSKQVH